MKQPKMNYKISFKKDRWQADYNKSVFGKENPSMSEISEHEFTAKEKAIYYNEQALRELKKTDPDWRVVKYNQGQAKRFTRLKMLKNKI